MIKTMPAPGAPKRTGASSTRRPSTTLRGSVQSILDHLHGAQELAASLAGQGDHKQSRAQLADNLATLEELKEVVRTALAEVAEQKGSARQAPLAALSLGVSGLVTQLHGTPFARSLQGLGEQLAVLTQHDALIQAQHSPQSPRRPLPTPPQGPPPLPPKVPLRQRKLPARTSGASDPGHEADGPSRSRSFRRVASDSTAIALGAIERQQTGLVQLKDHLVLSRNNDSRAEQAQNRQHYIKSLASSSVYGGQLEGIVMAEFLGVGLKVQQNDVLRPLMDIPPPQGSQTTVTLAYQPNHTEPRLSHYDAMVADAHGNLARIDVPADGNCMFYSMAVAANFRDARSVNAARTPEQLRALRQRYNSRSVTGSKGGEVSDQAFQRLLLGDIAAELRGRVAQALDSGRFDDALDAVIVSALAEG